jgi:hypothetical protein
MILFGIGVIDNGSKFATGIVNTGGNLLTLSTTPAVPVAKLAGSVVETSDKLPPM